MSQSKFYLKLGFTLDTDPWISRLIHMVTKGPSHALVEVLEVTPEGRHERYYFESVWMRDSKTGKDGMRGPISLTNLTEWVTGGSKRSLVEVPETGYLPLTQAEARDAVHNMHDAVRYVGYARSQLGANLTAAALDLAVTVGGGSKTRWTCCEAPIRCDVLPARFWKILGMADINADDFWPGGSARFSLLEAAKRVVHEFGTVTPE